MLRNASRFQFILVLMVVYKAFNTFLYGYRNWSIFYFLVGTNTVYSGSIFVVQTYISSETTLLSGLSFKWNYVGLMATILC